MEREKKPSYTVGIDLGTSNCAMAYGRLDEPAARLVDFPILQLEREGQFDAFPLLPSALYAPLPEEKDGSALQMPWPQEWVAGRFARWRGTRVPGRLITSAKSWLSHAGVDRTAPILPWGGAPDAPKISPVHASGLLLRHMRNAWNHSHPEEPLENQDVVITVPASFDEVARGLTVNAAREAGLEHFTLVEEPQAAFYHFSRKHQARLAAILAEIRLVLVIDVGGGTSDFTLVQVAASPEGPLMKRIAVGEHLILGGDNMDNALARALEGKLGGRKISAAQWIQLVQSARDAKEKLLQETGPDEVRIAIASEGSKLLGGTLSANLLRHEVESIIVEGFFPKISPTELPKHAARGGIQEMGLPYVADPSITRHLAAFLRKHAQAGFDALGQAEHGPEDLPRPDAILLNGGVFNSPKLADRLREALSAWWPGRPLIPLLEHGDLDLAVARGAASYGLVRHGRGRRISGGTAHSFYLGVAPEKGETESKAVCLIPRGFEEGDTVELTQRVFKLHLGKPVQFPIFTSTADQVDRPGDLVPVSPEFTPLPPIQTVLKGGKERVEKIPVYLRAKLTEIGTVEIWCASTEGNAQWRLEFDVRGTASEEMVVTENLPAHFSEAREYIAKIYGSRPGAVDKGPKDVKQLWSSLERLLGSRENWSVPVCRQLWGELFAGATRRRRTADHERIFFQLLGYTLRPGFGYPLDEWRCEQTFSLFADKVQFHKEKPNWNEFWVMWRRMAGGIKPERQQEMWSELKPHLALRVPAKAPKNLARPKGVQPDGFEEMIRAACALEQVPADEKAWLGSLIAERLTSSKPGGGPWTWSLGRLGARVPLHGSAHTVVPPARVIPWIDLLLTPELRKLDGSVFAVAQMSRLTGDRLRDLDERARTRVANALREMNSPESWLRMVTELTEMKAADEARVLGDTLPIGLQLTRNQPDAS